MYNLKKQNYIMCIPYVILKVEELQMFDILKIFDKCDVNHRETFTDKSNNGSFDLLRY